jgi:3-oxoacyl-[acyl-carrier protein] reductase
MAAKEQYLQGKVAIVTGSSKPNGIGAAIAIALAEHGANVCTFLCPVSELY